MGDSSRPPRASTHQGPQSDRPLQQSMYGTDSKSLNASSSVVHGNHINAHAFHSQHPLSLHHDQSTTSHMPAAQPSASYPARSAPMYTSTLNMGHMATVLPNHQSQFQQYPAQASPQHALPPAYGMSQPGHRYAATQLPYSPPYPHGQYVNAYMPVSPQNFSPSYTPHIYHPYPIYAQQTGQMYTPTFGGHQTYPQTTSHDLGDKAAHATNAATSNHAASPLGPMGSSVERVNDIRALYLEPGRMTSIVSSGQLAVKGTWFEQTPKTNIQMGPPIKPRQSGHALWVGNLPPGATVTDLKDHFSRGATKDIESVKLISKSNCAFVNYRTQAACVAAMNRFVEARFHGTRLVCRLRRTSVNNPNAPSPSDDEVPHKPSLDGNFENSEEQQNTPKGSSSESIKALLLARFFVLKSLTLHDLEISTQTGVWATQPHNEVTLNNAFKTAENVYLIFSANKSGEYFGYARMRSMISPSEQAAGVPLSKTTTSPIDVTAGPILTTEIISIIDLGPKAILTPPTEWAPKGRIIDDSARGTIFWEADIVDESSDDQTTTSPTTAEPTTASTSAQQPTTSGSGNSSSRQSSVSESLYSDEIIGSSSGNTFRVEWLSTRRVPFFKSRGLRNPWNANREVKIARDGTELETAVGGKLLQLFGPPSLPLVLQR